ncbi:MAG TPA: hypothetical protein VHY08_21540, partial [Bacillota bacterium]|nr:hypothetical protein [Bacillota bacterium]HEX3047350.1 hypothetical protein [Bacillota bacterium]
KLYLPGARPQQVPVQLKNDLTVVLERGAKPPISTRVIPLKKLKYPINVGQQVGQLQAIMQGKTIGNAAVYSTVKVKQANFLIRWWRAFWDFIGGIFRRKK